MMKYILSVAVFIATTLVSTAQIGIGTTTPDASAILHLEATGNQGLLVPRMSTADRDANILSPMEGIVVFNTTVGEFEVSTTNNGWTCLGMVLLLM